MGPLAAAAIPFHTVTRTYISHRHCGRGLLSVSQSACPGPWAQAGHLRAGDRGRPTTPSSRGSTPRSADHWAAPNLGDGWAARTAADLSHWPHLRQDDEVSTRFLRRQRGGTASGVGPWHGCRCSREPAGWICRPIRLPARALQAGQRPPPGNPHQLPIDAEFDPPSSARDLESLAAAFARRPGACAKCCPPCPVAADAIDVLHHPDS